MAAPVSSTGQAMEDVLYLYGNPTTLTGRWCASRDLHPVAGRGAGAVASSTRTTPSAGLRVSARWYPQYLPDL